MKKSLLFLPLLLIASMAYASTGKTMIPYWASFDSTGSVYYLSVSNTSDKSVSVEITLMNAAGNKLPSTVFYNLPNAVGATTSGANTFVLQAHQSKVIHLQGVESHGYGMIEWEQIGTASNILLATSWIKSSSTGHTAFTINGGESF